MTRTTRRARPEATFNDLDWTAVQALDRAVARWAEAVDRMRRCTVPAHEVSHVDEVAMTRFTLRAVLDSVAKNRGRGGAMLALICDRGESWRDALAETAAGAQAVSK